jgi:hypothetical protein
MQPKDNRPHYQLHSKPSYIDEGYSMTRTEAPKDFVGRGEVNLARTTPELPNRSLLDDCCRHVSQIGNFVLTVWPGNLAPDNANLGAADLLLSAVDVGDLLAEVEAGKLSALSFWSRGIGEPYLAALVSSTPSILIRLVPG